MLTSFCFLPLSRVLSMATFFFIAFSPWSVKARLALGYHDTPVEFGRWAPPITEWVIRWKTGNFTGKLTFPVLFKKDGSAVDDTFEIAKWSSENVGPKSRGNLFQDFDLEELKAWNAKANEIMNYRRIQAFDFAMDDDEAVLAAVPNYIKWLRPVAVRMGKGAVANMRSKYINEPGSGDADLARSNLLALRKALNGNRPYILGEFSFADVAMAVALQYLKPDSHLPLPPTLHPSYTSHELAEEFSDLVEWRDKLSEKHFKDLVNNGW